MHQSGELYFIEVLENGAYLAIGDVTLQENNPPIEIGIRKIYNTGCYEHNIVSQRMLEKAGFVLVGYDREKRRKVFEITLLTE